MRFSKLLPALACLFLLPLSFAAERRPNVLFIAVDDLNDYVGCLGGHPNGKTPHLDRFAEQAMLFTNAHTAAPVCNPSRIAFLTGLRPSTTGVYHNVDRWEHGGAKLQSLVHLPLHFHRHGYRTWMGGKIFHSAPDNLQSALDEDAGRFGGQNFDLRWHDFPDPFRDLKGIHNWAVHWGPLDDEQSSQLSDPKIAAWASEKLATPSDQPFLLMVGFHRPHTPITAPREYWELFDEDQLLLPSVNVNDLDDMPTLGRQVAIAGFQDMEGGHYKQITERGYHRDILRGYLAASAFVDAQIGKVLQAWQAGPHRDNTIVVLFSDHGWGIGERFHFKKWGLWDDTTHVPFIVHAPGLTQSGSRSDAGVTLLDLYPTLVDLCGLPEPEQGLDGQSLRPLLSHPQADWERPALTTYGPGNHALRTPRWRYIRWSDGSEELYDHSNDPHEWWNVADLPQHAAVKQRLQRWLPQDDASSLRSHHRSPLKLQPGDSRPFHAVQPNIFGRSIAVSTTLGPRVTDGVILHHAGMFAGYSLYVKDGKLSFALMDVPSPLQWDKLVPSRTILASERSLPAEQSVSVEAWLESDGRLTLFQGGEEVASTQASTLSIHPAGILRAGSAAGAYPPAGDHPTGDASQYEGDLGEITVTFGGDLHQ